MNSIGWAARSVCGLPRVAVVVGAWCTKLTQQLRIDLLVQAGRQLRAFLVGYQILLNRVQPHQDFPLAAFKITTAAVMITACVLDGPA